MMIRTLVAITLVTLIAGCSDNSGNLFHDLTEKENVVIYLSKYKLDSVPPDISVLRRAKRLSILHDSTEGWAIYPPLSAIEYPIVAPVFRKLPHDITELTNLEVLNIAALNLIELPPNFDQLQNLDSLDLSMNKLTISNEVEKLSKIKNLKYLALEGNKLDTADIEDLKKSNPNLVIIGGLE